ncbi:RNA ligase (ATP) [Paraburkholderia sp. A3RO-2L]|uniref:RNA ligase (ATP) n=1 Tax=unclassified Paraburkholderia TaxID=2615204 RepID=UPI0032F0B1E4|nr:RNA ligase (ATP) [Burkholderia vietnamiensis]
MSTFSVPIKRIRAIEMHPNADAIELAVIDGYRTVVKKGAFEAGELVAYIPQAALLPQWLLKRLGFWDAERDMGKLNGPEGNRVKAIHLRGELSQGICYPVITDGAGNGQIVTGDEPGCFANVVEGEDVAGLLGITKHVPEVPECLLGDVFAMEYDHTLNFDIEDWKAYPDVLQSGEEVIFTEKLHGICTVVVILPFKDAHPDAFGERKNILISSKGLMADGLAFKNNEKNRDNVYVKATRALVEGIEAVQRLGNHKGDSAGPAAPMYVLGETFGPGVQDLAYGTELSYRMFAGANGYRSQQTYYDWDDLAHSVAPAFGVEMVPVLYRGPFSEAVMREHTSGKTTLGAKHIREGIVMVPARERKDAVLGRVALKSVSAAYLTRAGGTEYS